MEMSILKAVDFDIGLPLSYSFLRRYARVRPFFFTSSRCCYIDVPLKLGKQS